MATTQQIERELIGAATSSDIVSIIDIISSLTNTEKTAVDPDIFDMALESIKYHMRLSADARADIMKIFMNAVGAYVSNASTH